LGSAQDPASVGEGRHRAAGDTIHRIFLRQQLVRDWDRQPMALRRFERAQPNQLWQMDFKGPKGWDQAVGPLSVLDDHSRYALALENTGSTQARGVQAVLERVFAPAECRKKC